MKSITAIELMHLINTNADIQLIDVREQDEHEVFNIGGLFIPLGSITQQMNQIDREKMVVLYCRKGVRSHIAIQRLQQKYPFKNLFNLSGGMDAWQRQFSQ